MYSLIGSSLSFSLEALTMGFRIAFSSLTLPPSFVYAQTVLSSIGSMGKI